MLSLDLYGARIAVYMRIVNPFSPTVPIQSPTNFYYLSSSSMAAPGGVGAPAALAAAAAAAAAAAPARYIYVGPAGSEERSLQRDATIRRFARLARKNTTTPLYAALMDAEIFPRLTSVGSVSRLRDLGGRWQAARVAAQGGARDVVTALRDRRRGNGALVGHRGTKKHAAMMFFGADGEGFDEDDTTAYLNGDFYEDLYEAIHARRFRGAPPQRYRLKVQIMYTVRQVLPNGPSVPQTLMGPAVVDLPRIWSSNEKTISTDENLADFCGNAQEDFRTYMEQYLGEDGSGYAFDKLVACYIWAIRTQDPGNAGGAVYGGRVKGTAMWDGSTNPFPRVLWASHGLVPNWPEKKDSMCIARAVMSGLDPYHDASSGANIVNICTNAVEGAKTWLLYAQRTASKPTVSDVVRANRSATVERAHAALATATTALADATTLVRSNPRRMIRTADIKAGRFQSTSRFLSIEQQLGLALRGAHPVMDFRSDYWREPQTLSSETLARLQSAVCLGQLVKFQLWAIGNCGTIGLAYADETATLDFLLKGGILINLLFAERHCSLIRTVSACCNHQVFVSDPSDPRLRAGYAVNRSICDLCGHHVTSTHAGFKWRIFEHQRAGCSRVAGAKLLSANSPNNRRQLTRYQYTTKMRSLVSAVWDADPTVACLDMRARLCTGWLPLQLSSYCAEGAEQWADIRKRYSHVHSALLPFAEPIHTARSLVAVGEHSTRDFWFEFARTENADEILAALHYVGPRSATALQTLLAQDPDGSASVCYGCKLPVTGPSRWDMQEAEDIRRGTVTEEQDPDDDSADLEYDPDANDAATVASAAASYIPDPACKHVVHHCHATGECFYAHHDCNSFMRQSTNALTIEVTTPEAMAAAVEVLFSAEFIEERLGGIPPTLGEVEGDVSRIVFKVPASTRGLHRDEIARLKATAEAEGAPFNEASARATRIKRVLTVTLRPRKAMLRGDDLVEFTPTTPSATARAATHHDTLLSLAETEFAATGLWPPGFPTYISYSMGVLLSYAAMALPPTVTPTSLSNPLSFQSAKALVTGGRIVMGDDVEWEPRPVEDRTRYRMYSDTTAAYPAQMIRWKLPCLEGDDRLVANFFGSETPEAALEFLAADDIEGDLVRRYEVWGAFPPELHAKYNSLPPQYSRIHVTGDMLSAFQRVAMDKGRTSSFGDRVVGHFFPFTGNVLFSRELKLLVKLGFVVERIGRVFETPASFWGREFAQTMQRRRRAAKARGDTAEEDAVKALSNSVIGALAKDPSRYKKLLTEKGYRPPRAAKVSAVAAAAATAAAATVEMDDDSLDALDADADSYDADNDEDPFLEAFSGRVARAADDPRFTLRILKGGDCVFLEYSRASWVHTAQTLAFAFIQAMARVDLVAKVFGGEGAPGIRDVFPAARIGYGCTDSLCIDISLTPADIAAGKTDARVEYFRAFQHRVDASNIPATSTFWDAFSADELPAVKAYVHEHAGEWGRDKDETCGAGIEWMLENGPNRWYLRVGQTARDTPAKYLGEDNRDILKSLPKSAKNQFKAEDVARSWYGAPLAVPPALPDAPAMIADGVVAAGGKRTLKKRRKGPIVWGHAAAIVSRETYRFRNFALGSRTEEAEALRKGDAW